MYISILSALKRRIRKWRVAGLRRKLDNIPDATSQHKSIIQYLYNQILYIDMTVGGNTIRWSYRDIVDISIMVSVSPDELIRNMHLLNNKIKQEDPYTLRLVNISSGDKPISFDDWHTTESGHSIDPSSVMRELVSEVEQFLKATRDPTVIDNMILYRELILGAISALGGYIIGVENVENRRYSRDAR